MKRRADELRYSFAVFHSLAGHRSVPLPPPFAAARSVSLYTAGPERPADRRVRPFVRPRSCRAQRDSNPPQSGRRRHRRRFSRRAKSFSPPRVSASQPSVRVAFARPPSFSVRRPSSVGCFPVVFICRVRFVRVRVCDRPRGLGYAGRQWRPSVVMFGAVACVAVNNDRRSPLLLKSRFYRPVTRLADASFTRWDGEGSRPAPLSFEPKLYPRNQHC